MRELYLFMSNRLCICTLIADSLSLSESITREYELCIFLTLVIRPVDFDTLQTQSKCVSILKRSISSNFFFSKEIIFYTFKISTFRKFLVLRLGIWYTS